MILNFHTHSPEKEDGIMNFYNADLRKGSGELLMGDFRCGGIHPWWIDYFDPLDKDKIAQILLNENILCIGEIGLDRSFREIDFSRQVDFFEFQLEVAIRREDKFIIIHCVRAYQEILNSVKKVGYKGKLVFHDYNGNDEMTQKLVDLGHYFSYGNMLFKKESKAMSSLKYIPLKRLFIETDDQFEFSIQDAYSEASSFLEVETLSLIEQCMKNFVMLRKF